LRGFWVLQNDVKCGVTTSRFPLSARSTKGHGRPPYSVSADEVLWRESRLAVGGALDAELTPPGAKGVGMEIQDSQRSARPAVTRSACGRDRQKCVTGTGFLLALEPIKSSHQASRVPMYFHGTRVLFKSPEKHFRRRGCFFESCCAACETESKSVGLRPATTAPPTKLKRTPRLESCVERLSALRAN
jgi:hypothetical protein